MKVNKKEKLPLIYNKKQKLESGDTLHLFTSISEFHNSNKYIVTRLNKPISKIIIPIENEFKEQ